MGTKLFIVFSFESNISLLVKAVDPDDGLYGGGRDCE